MFHRHIRPISPSGRNGFSIPEVLVSSVILLYVFMSMVAMYIMSMSWWNNTLPRIQAQQVVRTTLAYIVDGVVDPTAGTDLINGVATGRRNGIAWADSYSVSANSISYGLEVDSGNPRSFNIGTGGDGYKALYYTDSSGTVHSINATKVKAATGGLAVTFSAVGGYTNLVNVSVAVQRTIYGTRSAPYTITAQDSKTVFLRNSP